MTAARSIEPQPAQLIPNGAGPADTLEADARTDPDGATDVLLAGRTVRVLPVKQWRSSAIRAMRDGDFDTWAEKCLADDESYDTWTDVDPTIEEVEQFFTNWQNLTGESPGKSSGRPRSSTRTRRR